MNDRSPAGAGVRRLLLALSLCLAACTADDRRNGSAEIVVSGASSLTDVLTDLASAFAASHPGMNIRYNFGASGMLEQQIRRGADVDLFISAASRQMDALARDGLIDVSSRRVLAGNELLLVAPRTARDSLAGFADLVSPEVERVAIGTPASVPAGEYARAALESMGLWPAVQPKVVFTANVRQALTYAERGEVDAALVYRTDAARSERIRVVAVAPASSHPPIAYPAALVAGRGGEAAGAFLTFLSGPAAAPVFRRHGFTLPPAPER